MKDIRHDFCAYLHHDLKRGIGRRWVYFLVAAILSALVCGQLCQHHHQLMTAGDLAQVYGVEPTLSLGDYWCYLFQGTKIYVPGDPDFQVNIWWVIMQVYLAFTVALFPFQDLAGYGQQLLLRARKRTLWWISKCVWLAASVAAFYIAIMLTILVFGFLSGAALTLKPHAGVQAFFSNVDAGRVTGGFWLNAILLPLVTSLSLSFIQMALSLLTRPLIGLFMVTVILSGSIFYYSHWLLGNYLMLMRISLTGGIGVQPIYGFILGFSLILGSVAAGTAIIHKKDIIGNE